MATSVEEITQTTSPKLEAAMAAGNWVSIHGNLQEILTNEQSTGIALFEKDIKKDSEKSVLETADMKTSAEAKQRFKPLQIVILRCADTTIDVNSLDYPIVSNGKRPVCLLVFWGEGTRRIVVGELVGLEAIYSLEYSTGISSCFQFKGPASMAFNSFRIGGVQPFFVSDTNPEERGIITAQGRFFCEKYIGIKMEKMRDVTLQHLFSSLQEMGLCDSGDIKFWNALIPHKDPSREEMELNKRLELALDKEKYEESVQIVGDLYTLFRKEAKAQGSPCTLQFHDKIYPIYFLESDAALRLATELEKASQPLLAMDALKILAVYTYKGNQAEFGESNTRYYSPYAQKALERIVEIRASMPVDANIPAAEKKKFRSKTIETMYKHLSNNVLDGKNRNSDLRYFDLIVKAHCGNEVLDAESSQENIDEVTDLVEVNVDVSSRILLRTSLIMMQEISDLRKKVEALEAAAKERDAKQRSESQAVGSAQQPIQVVPSSATSLTYMLDARIDVKSSSSNNQTPAESQVKKGSNFQTQTSR